MKYYSEKTKQLYNTEKELRTAETDFDIAIAERELAKEKAAAEAKAKAEAEITKANMRKARQKEVEDAYKHYFELSNKYAEDYGLKPAVDVLLDLLNSF